MTDTNQTDPDRLLHAAQARITGGLSPSAAALALTDWALHLANSPSRQAALWGEAVQLQAQFARWLVSGGKADAPVPEPQKDRRFRDSRWQKLPYGAAMQGFLAAEKLWDTATQDIDGVSKHHLDMLRFGGRQVLDMLSPSNSPLLNPEIVDRIRETGGMNLFRGAQHMFEDWLRQRDGLRPAGTEAFRVGKELAVTPGKVVFRNDLIELIQYSPTTAQVRPQPVLFVPAWIMKYYILDLRPENSMVRWLVDQGFTVFMISWRNPGAEMRDFGMSDYAEQGVLAALDAIAKIVPDQQVHTAGYCIGGTLLSLVAALLGQRGQDRLASVTLFAAQMDFSEAGELMLFIDDSQLAFLESMMAEKGYLESDQMSGAFQMLRSSDLIWSRVVRDYLMGERAPVIDLLAWNADATRMPAQMHSEYLRKLFLDNDFAGGRYHLGDTLVTPPDIGAPIFQVGTEADHVAPWQSAFKVALLTDVDVTFVLTSGGHNAGIVSPPGHPRRHYRIGTLAEDAPLTSPEDWLAQTPELPGSWWPAWAEWLAARSGNPVKPPAMGAPRRGLKVLADAPGTYVLER